MDNHMEKEVKYRNLGIRSFYFVDENGKNGHDSRAIVVPIKGQLLDDVVEICEKANFTAEGFVRAMLEEIISQLKNGEMSLNHAKTGEKLY